MLVKVKFVKNGKPAGRPYTYLTDLALQIGDRVLAGKSVAEVVELDVPAEEVAAFADRLKRIDVKFLDEGPETPDGSQEAVGREVAGKEETEAADLDLLFAGMAGREDFFG